MPAPLAPVTCLCAARLGAGLAGRLLGSRRSREVGTVLGLALAALAVPAVITLASLGLEGVLETIPSVALVLGVQFWYGDRGGSYIHWDLPLLLMMIFRPNLTAARPPERLEKTAAA